MRKIFLVLLAVVFTVPVLSAQEVAMQPEAYTAVAVGTGGAAGGKTIPFDFRVTYYATDQDIERLATILREKGRDALRSAMEKLNAGRINPVGTVGNQIAVARKRQQGNVTIITIVTARDMSFAELYRSNRSVDYPFGFLQVKLNEKGEGTGQVIGAAKIRFDKKKGKYEIESYGNQYVKVANVRPNK